MPRRPRLVVPGIPHHITQRGNNRQPVFQSPDDRRLYLQLLVRHSIIHKARILGYCLMTNHVHLVIVPDREDSLAHTLGRIHSEYAQAVNRAGARTGHLWQNRFFSCVLDPPHFQRALQYVDLNPVRAGLAGVAWEWPWSSAAAHVDPNKNDAVLDPEWIQVCGGWNFDVWRRLVSEPPVEDWAELRRATLAGDPLGSREFVRNLERETGRRLRVLARGRPRKEPGSAVAGDGQESLFAGAIRAGK